MTTALDVAIGLVFMYLLLALLVSTLQEFLAGLFSLRAKQLYAAIEGMLKDGPGTADKAEQSSLVQQLYKNPLISNLAEREFKAGSGKLLSWGDGLPAYIPSASFAVALIQILNGKAATDATGAAKVVTTARELVSKIQVKKLRETLEVFLTDIERTAKTEDEKIAQLSERIEQWFNDRMARVSGWYKRKAQTTAFVLAALVSGACNASTIHVAKELWTNASLRAAVVANAQAFQKAGSELTSSSIPLGWFGAHSCEHLALRALGWLMTALAVSLGATFWFDTLGKLLNVRSAGPRVSAQDGKVEA